MNSFVRRRLIPVFVGVSLLFSQVIAVGGQQDARLNIKKQPMDSKNLSNRSSSSAKNIIAKTIQYGCLGYIALGLGRFTYEKVKYSKPRKITEEIVGQSKEELKKSVNNKCFFHLSDWEINKGIVNDADIPASDVITGKGIIANIESELSKLCEGKSDYDKALIVYDYIFANCGADIFYRYRKSSDEELTTANHTIYGCLVNHCAVCEGIALSYMYLLGRFGVSCGIVYNYPTPGGSGHAWNVVQIGDKWYYVDLTWPICDPRLKYKGFMRTIDEIKKDHPKIDEMRIRKFIK